MLGCIHLQRARLHTFTGFSAVGSHQTPTSYIFPLVFPSFTGEDARAYLRDQETGEMWNEEQMG